MCVSLSAYMPIGVDVCEPCSEATHEWLHVSNLAGRHLPLLLLPSLVPPK